MREKVVEPLLQENVYEDGQVRKEKEEALEYDKFKIVEELLKHPELFK